jgi:hypothetical protein
MRKLTRRFSATKFSRPFAASAESEFVVVNFFGSLDAVKAFAGWD